MKDTFIPFLRRCFRWFVVLIALSIIVYLGYVLILWTQFSTNQAKWLNNNTANYSVVVRYSNNNAGVYSEAPEIVQDEHVTQGYRDSATPAGKPVIEWAFEQAKSCISSWIVCSAFSWSFEYDPTYGYPSRIQYHDYDWLYTIEITAYAPSKP